MTTNIFFLFCFIIGLVGLMGLAAILSKALDWFINFWSSDE